MPITAERTRRGAMIIALVLSLLGVIGVAIPAAASTIGQEGPTNFSVSSSGPMRFDGVLPGDHLAMRTVTVHATGSVDYRVTPRVTGSQALAKALIVTIAAGDTGEVLYHGPLADAQAALPGSAPHHGRRLRNAGERLTITADVAQDAGNDVQAAGLSVDWVVEAMQSEVSGT